MTAEVRPVQASEATLAAVLAKLSADPATATGVAAIVSALASIGGTVTVANPTADPATQTTLEAIRVLEAASRAVTVAALPLPSGAATSALQGGGLPAALGQTTKALSLPVVQPGAATAARTSVAAAVADTALLAADPTRLAATVYNDSTALLYVGYGATAVSTTNYSVQVPAGGYLEVPREFVACVIRGYWAAANGYARITVG